MTESRRSRRRLLFDACAVTVLAAVAAGCMPGSLGEGSFESSPTAQIDPIDEPSADVSPTPGVMYRIGLSEVGDPADGWHQAMVCAAKAQATATGAVSRLTVLHRDADAAAQVEDVRRLIADDVDAIVVEPAGAKELPAALAEAVDAGIVVVTIDRPVSAPGTFSVAVDHERSAYLGASWLFAQLGGKGPVVYMHGDPDKAIAAAQDKGFRRALSENKKIKVAKDIDTKADPARAVVQLNDLVSAGTAFSGIWTSGIDSTVVDALKFAGHPAVPIVGSDSGSFVRQMLAEDGPKGAAVADPPAVGAAGVELALRLLSGQVPPDGPVLLEPVLWSNADEAGLAALAAVADPNVDPLWPLGLTIPGWTDYATEDVTACKSPSE
jgi:ribose transport system substrate-binding protein